MFARVREPGEHDCVCLPALTGETIDGEGERVLGRLEVADDGSARGDDLLAARWGLAETGGTEASA